MSLRGRRLNPPLSAFAAAALWINKEILHEYSYEVFSLIIYEAISQAAAHATPEIEVRLILPCFLSHNQGHKLEEWGKRRQNVYQETGGWEWRVLTPSSKSSWESVFEIKVSWQVGGKGNGKARQNASDVL